MQINKRLVQVAAVFGFWGVASGAFGAHALKDNLSQYALDIWQTGILYLLLHTLVILFLAIVPNSKMTRIAANCFIAGSVIFAGSLQLLAITGISYLGAVTPIGGLLFIIGWCCLFVLGLKFNKKD